MRKKQIEEKKLTAEEYRLIARKNMLACKNQMKIFLYTGLVLITALTIITVIAVAWFASNRSVEAEGMGVTIGFNGFELKSEGIDPDVEVHNGTDSFVVKASNLLSVISGGKLSVNNLRTDIADGIFSVQTDAQNMCVNWLMGQGSGFDEILPGASGVLSFYVKADYAKEISLVMDVKGYSVTDQRTSMPITMDNSETETGLYLVDSDSIAAALLRGHILFFEPEYKIDENGDYVLDENGDRIVTTTYHTLLNQQEGAMKLSTISITKEQAEQGAWIPVNIYWIWPIHFGQMILPDGAIHLKSFVKKGFFTNAVRDELKTKMTEQKQSFFYNSLWYDYPDSVTTEEEKAAYTDNLINQSVTAKNLEELRTGRYSYAVYSEYSHYYNCGDQYIGTNVDYLLVSVTAE